MSYPKKRIQVEGVVKRIFGSKEKEIKEWRKLHYKELHFCILHQISLR
jgi:hypothetical protein